MCRYLEAGAWSVKGLPSTKRRRPVLVDMADGYAVQQTVARQLRRRVHQHLDDPAASLVAPDHQAENAGGRHQLGAAVVLYANGVGLARHRTSQTSVTFSADST